MKFTLSWLNKYLKTKKSFKDICDKLTMLGIEIFLNNLKLQKLVK